MRSQTLTTRWTASHLFPQQQQRAIQRFALFCFYSLSVHVCVSVQVECFICVRFESCVWKCYVVHTNKIKYIYLFYSINVCVFKYIWIYDTCGSDLCDEQRPPTGNLTWFVPLQQSYTVWIAFSSALLMILPDTHTHTVSPSRSAFTAAHQRLHTDSHWLTSAADALRFFNSRAAFQMLPPTIYRAIFEK